LEFDDIKASAQKIGEETLKKFVGNIKESFTKYGTSISQEIIGVHGYDHTGKFYNVSLYWKEYKHIDPKQLTWKKEGYGVSGYLLVGEKLHKVMERVNGNAKREGTCFKEYKNLTAYVNCAQLQVPIPDPWAFDPAVIRAEIALKK
jgi:hypothetical protein